MEQVTVGDVDIQHSEETAISTSSFIDTEGNQVVLAVSRYRHDGVVEEAKCGRVYKMPETATEASEVFRAMKREVLRELVTYLEMEGIL